jgi:hypothetical protein
VLLYPQATPVTEFIDSSTIHVSRYLQSRCQITKQIEVILSITINELNKKKQKASDGKLTIRWFNKKTA